VIAQLSTNNQSRLFLRLMRSPLSVIGLAIVVLAAACIFLAPFIAPYNPMVGDIDNAYLKPPSAEHPFGTDDAGRDILSRVIYGAQISLRIALLAEGLGLTIGVVIGLITGYYGGWIDIILMRIVDVFMAFPLLIIAIALAAAFGPGEFKLILALSLTIWPFAARLVRSLVLSVRETEYIAAAQLLGVRPAGIMFQHILPNIITPLVVFATLGIANIILQEAALSFLGLGNTDINAPSWGKMLFLSRQFIRSEWWMAFYPGLAILLTVLGFNLLGDGLRDALDVRSD